MLYVELFNNINSLLNLHRAMLFFSMRLPYPISNSSTYKCKASAYVATLSGSSSMSESRLASSPQNVVMALEYYRWNTVLSEFCTQRSLYFKLHNSEWTENNQFIAWCHNIDTNMTATIETNPTCYMCVSKC